MIDAKAKVCGLMAWPIGHSLSPCMHHYFSEGMNINEIYVPFPVPVGSVETAIQGAYALGIHGLNVSLPHKPMALTCCSSLDDSGKLVGAVNTLVRTENGYRGYNTDLYGLTRSIVETGTQIKDSHGMLIGAGGAAQAAAVMFAVEGAEDLVIVNRSRDKAQALADLCNSIAGRDMATVMTYEELPQLPGYGTEAGNKRYLAVQTTSLGMEPHPETNPIEDEAVYAMLHTAVDIVYKPMKTGFLIKAAMAGAKTISGLKMLLYQGVRAYELWNDVVLPDDVIENAYRHMEEEL